MSASPGSGSSASKSFCLEEHDRQGVLDFWRVYEAHYDEVSRAIESIFSADATLSLVFDGPAVVRIRAVMRELARRGVETGDWSAYDAQLRATGESYARAGLTCEAWYVVTVCLADTVAPHLVTAYGAEPARLIEALRGMRRFLDRTRVVLTTEFITAKELALAESEKRMRALAAKLHSAIEQERRRIAREIHDDLGQQLMALKLDHSLVLRRFETRDRSDVGELLADMGHLLDAAVATVRRLATDLRPSILDEFGLVAALEWHARAVQSRSGLRFHVTLPEQIDAPDEHATGIFRMFQEVLTNVVRHAGATEVSVRVEVVAGTIVLEVRDDGRGITPEEAEGGGTLGLVGMRERADLLGGRVEVDGPSGGGTTVRIEVPMRGDARG